MSTPKRIARIPEVIAENVTCDPRKTSSVRTRSYRKDSQITRKHISSARNINKKNKEIPELPTRKCSVLMEKYRADEYTDSSSESDDNTEEIMLKITRNGSAIERIRKIFDEILNREEFVDNISTMECIMGCERKKSTILLPCRHQHTCEPCWFLWKIHQINKMSTVYENDDIDDDDDDLKPVCPVCKVGVDEAISAFN